MKTNTNYTVNSQAIVSINNKKYNATIKDIFSDCIGIELPYAYFIGACFKKDSGELVRLTTISRCQILS